MGTDSVDRMRFPLLKRAVVAAFLLWRIIGINREPPLV